MKKHRRPFKNEGGDSLEYYIQLFREHCEVCKSEIVVHSFRRGNPKWRKAVFGHCENKQCRNFMTVICYYL